VDEGAREVERKCAKERRGNVVQEQPNIHGKDKKQKQLSHSICHYTIITFLALGENTISTYSCA